MEDLYLPKQATIQKVWTETEDINTFRIGYPCNHDPGQFVQVSLFHYGEAPISISSYSKKYLELSVRKVGRVTNILHQKNKGDKIGIRGPFGRGYPMHYLEKNNLLVIAGGTGVAPVRGVIDYVMQNRNKFKEVDLYLGFRNPSQILFERDLKNWEKQANLTLTVDQGDHKWKGNVGLLPNLIKESELNNKDRVVVTCGPPIMIKYTIQALTNLGFNDDQIYMSLERLMKCGVQKCGHCLIKDKYVCSDGPVFNYREAKLLED